MLTLRPWWVRVVIVALAYGIAGRLALLFAIPPGFATAIWPAAGLAVIAVSRWSWPAAVGVAIGSFLVNLSTGGAAIGAALALGPALQATLAALLVRRALRDDLSLERGRDIALFYVLAGPIACLVAATWGMIVLYGGGVITSDQLAYSWITWWMGDTVGVMLAAPILLVFVGEPRAMWRRRWLSIGLLLTMVMLGIVIAYTNSIRFERDRDARELALRADAVTNAIRQRLESYRAFVQALASFLAANRSLEPEQFATFSSGTFGRDRDIYALAWAPRVTPETRAAFETAAQHDGPFEIRELRGTSLVRAEDRPEMFPALYVQPANRPRGFDVASEPMRREAIRRARESREPVASRPLVMLPDTPGFVIVAPVYSDHEPELLGVAIGAFSTTALLASATAGMRTDDLAIAISDVHVPEPPAASATSNELAVAGVTWRIDVARAHPSDLAWPSWFAFVRLFVGSLSGAVLLVITGGRRRFAAVEARTIEVERRNLEDLLVVERDQVFQLELGDILHSSESVRGVLGRAAARVSDYLELDKCHFAEIDVAAGQVVVHQYTRGKKLDADEIATISSFEASGLGDLVRGSRIVIADIATDPQMSELYERAYAPREIRAFIAVPLMRGGVCVAYFGAVSATARDWTQREVSLVQSVAERTWLWAEHLRSLHVLRANEAQLRELSADLEQRVAMRTRELVRAVGEKEALLKEIHHRVKNNLQVISSMLNLQARRITDAAFKNAFDDSQQRIQTIALVHERLYQSPDLSSIGFDDYLTSLVANVMSAQNAAARSITATTDVGGVRMPIQRAIPCGLIVNELVTNALKHAFPDGRAGTIAVSMMAVDGQLELRVADDGIGLPAAFDPANVYTLGLDLVYTFAEQVDATVDVRSSSEGAVFTLRFLA